MEQLDLPESSGEVADQPEAAPSTESELSDLINEIVKPGQAGYVYGRLDRLMDSKGIPETGRKYLTRFKRASSSSRGANVMKESPQQTATVYFVLLMQDYEPAQIKPILLPDMKRSPEQCEAVVLLEKSVNDWKVSEIIAHTDGPTLERLKELFPEDPKEPDAENNDPV